MSTGRYYGVCERGIISLFLVFLAQMETASSCGGVRHKRYSGQLEIAPRKKPNITAWLLDVLTLT